MKTIRLAPVLLLAAFALAACNDDEDSAGGGGGGDPQDQFGSAFAQAFDADANDEPVDPEPGDAGELSLTADPVDF